jgi:hypothetical protein
VHTARPSTPYARRRVVGQPGRPGPVSSISDEELVRLIRQVLADSPFAGEGYRKVRARLRREHGVHVSGKRVLRLLRREGLPAPQRARGRRRPRPHDGTIIPRRRTGVGAPTPPWPGPGSTAGCGCSPEAWAHVAKVGDGSLPRSRSMTRSSTAGPAGCGRGSWPVAAPRLGTLIPLGPLPGLDRLAGDRRRRRLPGQAGDQRLRRTLDPHLEGAMPVDGAVRHYRLAPPGRDRLRPLLQHPVVDRTARPPHPKGGLPSRPTNRGGMIR